MKSMHGPDLHDPFPDQLNAARFKAERDAARQELARLRDEVEAMRPRLMPEGMEWLLEVWPKWSNGEYCKFGDWWTADKYGDYEPKQLRRLVFYTPEQLREWEQDEGDNFGYEWDFMRPSDTTYRPDKAEPPALKVLDADEVEIRVGDTVYDKDTGDRFEVDGFSHDFVACTDIDACESDLEIQPSQLTHRAPVLAADGKPLEAGQTVWTLDNPSFECGVIGFGNGMVYLKSGAGHPLQLEPSDLTHQRPVLDADGVPLREGETVYDTVYGEDVEVVDVFAGTTESDFPGCSVKCRKDGDEKYPVRFYNPSTLIHRVLDSDGAECRVGDTVYSVKNGVEMIIHGFEDGEIDFKYAGSHGRLPEVGRVSPRLVTHRAPVLAADGKPLDAGQTVWDTKGNGPYSIEKIETDGTVRIYGTDLDYFGNDFVHERPDSWERIEDDADRGPQGGADFEEFARDLVRRAKALAGVSE